MTLHASRGNKNLGERVKVLLADDSVTMHRAVRLALKNEAFEVITCDNGQDALRLCLEHRPRIVLADLDMPLLTGPELAVAIKKNPELKDSKVILLCGSFDQVDESRLGSVPTDGRIWKPFEAHALVAMLKALLKDNPSSEVKESSSPTGTLSLHSKAGLPLETPQPPSREWVKQSQDVTSPELEKDLMEETFKVAETATPQDYVRQSSEPTSLGLKLPETPSRATEYPTLPTIEEDAFQASVSNEQATENLWSEDFKVDQPQEPSYSMAQDPAQALDATPQWESDLQRSPAPQLSDDFEIVTSSINILSPDLPSRAELDGLSSYSSPTQESSLQPDFDERAPVRNIEIPTYDPELSVSDLSVATPEESPALVSEDEWVKDRDFSDYKSPGIQEHQLSEPLASSPPLPARGQSHISLDEAQIKKMIQGELQTNVKVWLKEILEQELEKVLRDIERD